jgi:hypothetical protein
MWERALRRSGLPVAWSGGFSPRPLLSFGHALATGAESLAEYLDVSLLPGAGDQFGWSAGDLGEPSVVARSSDALSAHLSRLLPEGVDVQVVAALRSGRGSLQQEVSSCSWKLEVLGLAAEELVSRVERLLAAPTALIERERKGRSALDDLRPAVLALSVEPRAGDGRHEPTHPGGQWLDAELATSPRGVRPSELLEVLGPGVALSRARRTHQWIERDGIRMEPLAVGGREAGAVAAHARGRAS